jgi:hypothetical protein
MSGKVPMGRKSQGHTSNLSYILYERGLHKGVNARKMGQFASAKSGDILIFYGRSTWKTNLQATSDLCIVLGSGNVCFL